MPKAPKAKSGQRTSLKQTREAIHRTLDDIRELNGDIADEYVEWVHDSLHEPNDPIKKLFDRAGLNPINLNHWIALLSYVVEAVYTERRGAPAGREEMRLLAAAYRIHTGAKRKGYAIGKEDICKALKKNNPLGVLKTGLHKGSLRETKTLLGKLERALTNLEDEFVYPARRKELEALPNLREKYERWLDALRPTWRTRLKGATKGRLRKTNVK